MLSADTTRVNQAQAGTIWDPRADMDDDGDVDLVDSVIIYPLIALNWDNTPNVTVSQAFSDVGNPFMFQGRPHFALDTLATATAGKLNPIDMPAKREVLTRAPTPNAAEAVWQGFSWNDPQGMAGAAMLLVDLPPSRH